MENRDYLFDNAKGLMIFAVVLGHVLEYDLTGIARALYIVIYSVHMPLFVLISGYFAQFNAEKIVKKLHIFWDNGVRPPVPARRDRGLTPLSQNG